MATPEVQTQAAFDTDLIEVQRMRGPRLMPRRDRIVAWASGLVFLALAGALAASAPTHVDLTAAVVLVGLYALVSRVGFEIVNGLALPTELVLVPMLFVLPPAVVPLLVAAALVLRNMPDVVRRDVHPERLLLQLLSAAHALGPAFVLTLAGAGPVTVGRWPLYAVALASQFVMDFAASASWARYSLGISFGSCLRDIRWPWTVDAALAPIALVIAAEADHRTIAVLVVLPLVGLLAFFARERQVRIDHALELSKAYRGTAMVLGDVIEADDAYTGSHSRDVVDLVLLVADLLGLQGPMRRDAEFAALLHDVGKVKIPSEIINKPGSLDDREWEIMKTHTIAGEEMLERVGGLLGHIGKIVRSCHERWDGQGYPDGLAAEKIPLIARIVMCCDAFSAMTTDRAYRKAMTDDAAVEELLRCRGTHFDPRVVDALVEAVGQGRQQPQPLAA